MLTIESATKYVQTTLKSHELTNIKATSGRFNHSFKKVLFGGFKAVLVQFKINGDDHSMLVWIDNGSLYGEW